MPKNAKQGNYNVFKELRTPELEKRVAGTTGPEQVHISNAREKRAEPLKRGPCRKGFREQSQNALKKSVCNRCEKTADFVDPRSRPLRIRGAVVEITVVDSKVLNSQFAQKISKLLKIIENWLKTSPNR